MKVLMATMQLDIGGAETHIVELSKALKRRGVDVIVASAGGAYEAELKESGIRHIHVPLSGKKPGSVIAAYKKLKEIILTEKIDVVHGHARIPCFILNMIRRSVKFRFVTTAHWVFSLKFPYKYISKWGDRSLAVSEDIKKYLIDNYGIRPGNIRVTINGIDTGKFSKDTDWSAEAEEFKLVPGMNRIVSVSRMDKDRSLAAKTLISIADRLDKSIPNLELLIVGGGNDFAEMKLMADEMNKKIGRDVIKYTGGRTDINRLVASGKIFVGVSRAALEAMAAEKPSIIAGNEGYIGIFDKDKLGISIDTNFCCRGCEPTDAEKLYRDLITLFRMTDERLEELGSYSKSVIEQYYSIETMADDAMKMYVSVIKYENINDVSENEFADIDNYLLPKPQTHEYDAVISGYYGFGNSGDDSILKAIVSGLKRIKPDIRILALSNRPSETRSVYGVDSIHRFNLPLIYSRLRRSKLLISGGGSLIQDVTSDKSLSYYLWIIRLAIAGGAKTMIYAGGIGPIINERNYKKICSVLGRMDTITLREDSSVEELKKIGVSNPEIHVTADPAFTLCPTTDENTESILRKAGIGEDEEYFCVSVRPWKSLDKELERSVSKAAKHICEKYNLKALFIPLQCPKDEPMTVRAAEAAGSSAYLAPEGLTPEEMIGLCKGAKFVIGMRLHILIYALSMATPVIGLIYDPKITAVLKFVGQSEALDVKTLTAKELCASADNIIENYDKLCEELEISAANAYERAQLTAETAVKLMEELEELEEL